MKVVDASVAVKWFVKENDQETALEVLYAIQNNPDNFIVPDLFFIEMLNIFCKLCKQKNIVYHFINILENMGFHRIQPGHEILNKAAQIACEYGLSGYDAIYASTALLSKAQWLTADKKAHEKIKSLNISMLL